ncbi:MAG: translation elongation factor EF-1 subunit alpha [Thermoplasmatota archaeon]
MAEKPHMNIVFIGHVDHGKSTMIGRLLLDTGHIQQYIIDKFKEEAASKGKTTFEFAWVMDVLKEERERGVTIDVAHKPFTTDKYYFTIIDCPGHRDFIKNMITGTSQGDGAILVCSAAEGAQAQTREHIFLARTLGIPQLVVAINKMDAVEYSQQKFEETKSACVSLLKNVGYKTDSIAFVPVSAFVGDNVAKKSDRMPWYKGPTLVDALNSFTVPEKPVGKPLRLPVQDVYSITGVGTVPVGRVETGTLKPNEKVVFMPSGKVGEVKSIEMHHQALQQAVPGDNIGFNVRGIAKQDVKRGDVVGHADNPPTVAKAFTARIMVLNHPSVITAGYTPVFHCHTAQVACTIEAILQKLDPKTGAVLEENPNTIKTGDAAVVKVRPTKPMVVETAKDFPPLGKFAIRDMGITVAAGMVMEVEKR